MAAIMAVTPAAPEPEDDTAYLWPCNVATWGVWVDVQTQWRHSGMGSVTGLDYAGVRAHLDELGLFGDERRDVYTGIRAAECAHLDARAELAEQEQCQKR